MKYKEYGMLNKLTIILGSVLLTGCTLFGVRNEEEPKFKIITQQDNKEIRLYEPYILAQTQMSGGKDYRDSQNKAFRLLFNYISGENKANQKIQMTVPVTQSDGNSGEKIAMTAPVMQSEQGDIKVMSFVLPSKYNMQTAPQPTNKKVSLKRVPAEYVGVIRFTGRDNAKINEQKTKELLEWLSQQSEFIPKAKPYLAVYNPPWTIPWLRRNEMMVKLQKVSD